MGVATISLWIRSFGSTFLVSTAPLLILFLIPVQSGVQTKKSQSFWKVLLSFASGGLLGDAFLHLIPHANIKRSSVNDHHIPTSTVSHGHSHGQLDHEAGDHDHDLTVGLYVLSGIITFLFIEQMIRILKGGDNDDYDKKKFDDADKDNRSKKNEAPKRKDSDDKSSEVRLRKTTDKDKSNVHEHKVGSDIKVAGYLNLAADFAHNVTDGLAIGASFLAGNSFGLVTTLTVLLHEIPHEVGDFAILVQSGCTKRNAILLQFVTALGTVLGCCISLCATDPSGVAEAAAASWVLPFTAGGYIYVATVSVIPELLEECDSFWQSIKEIVALCVGVSMMILIAGLE